MLFIHFQGCRICFNFWNTWKTSYKWKFFIIKRKLKHLQQKEQEIMTNMLIFGPWKCAVTVCSLCACIYFCDQLSLDKLISRLICDDCSKTLKGFGIDQHWEVKKVHLSCTLKKYWQFRNVFLLLTFNKNRLNIFL